jgi:D-alanyl-D-alanine carboxypeptidase
MNAKARQIGMTRTRFVNPNGLPAADQVTTARDLARLSAAVIRDFPEHAHYWAMPRMQIGKIKLASHNSLLRHFEGANGLKTGFICDSGFNIVASATRGDLRLMAVVLGSPSAGERTDRAEALLQHGFETFGWKQAFATANIGSAPLPGAAKPARSVRTSVKAAACGWRSPRAKRVLSATKKAKEPRAGKGATRQTYTLKPKGPPVAKPTAASKPAKTAPKTAVRRPAEAKARPKSE